MTTNKIHNVLKNYKYIDPALALSGPHFEKVLNLLFYSLSELSLNEGPCILSGT